MTVSYTGDVANGSSFGCFWKILHRWKGSVYKLIWRELIAYLIMYFVINACYRMGMDEGQKRTFEKVKVYCSKQIESIPMSFVLGFYVSLIVKRWWDQYWILPLPDSLALYICASINGQDERGRKLRRTIIRYAMLSYIITLQRISFRVKKRFPTLQHLVDTGLMMDSEKKVFDSLEEKNSVSKFWLPVIWASNLVSRAKLEGRIQSDHMFQTILLELSDFRRRLGRVMVYDNVSVPLVYTQVVTLAVYTYFLAALVGRQWVNPPQPWRSRIYPGYELDLYFPIFLSLQFIFYIGWLKVAETLINPFGEDDDDFELNWLIDRHIQVSFMVVDEMHEEHPELVKDRYWEEVVPTDLPYNVASEQFRRPEPKGSTASMKIKENESVYDNLTSVKRHSVIPDEVYADYASVVDSPLADNRKNWLQRQLSRVESFRSTSSSSSLFIRTRSQNKQLNNGHLPTNNFAANNSGLHRLSLYDRLMNRRSSKEQAANRNSPKIPPSANPARAINGTAVAGKDHLNTLVPHPLLRPRVPTPDVTKENQIHLFAANAVEKPLSTRNFNQANNNNSSNNNNNNNNMSSNTLSVQGHNFANSSSPINNLNSPTHDVTSNGGSLPRNGNSDSANIFGSRSKSPPTYDTNDTPHLMLTPIEENDGSPYSTSSTSRSSRSSNYPTTTSIFGGKPSPPPPMDEVPLPPIPDEEASSKMPYIQFKYPKIGDVLDHDSGLETIDGSFGEEPYMTIAEVNESKADLGFTETDEIETQIKAEFDHVMPMKIPKLPCTIIEEEKENSESSLTHQEEETTLQNGGVRKINNNENTEIKLKEGKVARSVKFLDSQPEPRSAQLQPHPPNLSRSSSFDKSTSTEDSLQSTDGDLSPPNLSNNDISEDNTNGSQNVQNYSVISSGTGNLKTVSAAPKAGDPNGKVSKDCEVFV